MSTITITDKEYQHIGETSGCKNRDHDHDLVHELSRRLGGVWRYDQYIANAQGNESLQRFWNKVKSQEQEDIEQLIEELTSRHIESDCF